MEKVVMGTFDSLADSEKLIEYIKNELAVGDADISYIYRNSKGKIEEVSDGEVTNAGEGAATGAVVGGSIGALAGLATIAGIIPVIGPIFAAGTLISALGISTAGAVGATAAGALTGAIAGSIIGALTNLGVGENEAKIYEQRVEAGDVLVMIETDEENQSDIEQALTKFGAETVQVFSPKVAYA